MAVFSKIKEFFLSTSKTIPAHRNLVGSWKVTFVDLSFAVGKIPSEKMGEAKRHLEEIVAPAFTLKPDGSALVTDSSTNSIGNWFVENNSVHIETSGKFLKLEINGDTLTTLPDRTFTFIRRR